MRIFVSIVVWLSSIKGTDGLLIVKPSHFAVVRGTPVRFTSTSNFGFPIWYHFKYTDQRMVPLVKQACFSEDQVNYGVNQSSEQSQYTCDLIVKPTAQIFSGDLSTRYICEDIDGASVTVSRAKAVLIIIESPLTCHEQDKVLSCSLQHSAYRNITLMYQYVEIIVVIKNPIGIVASNKSAGVNDVRTVVTVALDGGRTFPTTNPYICTVEFKSQCDPTYEDLCVSDTTVIPGDLLECKYQDTDWGTTTQTTTPTTTSTTTETTTTPTTTETTTETTTTPTTTETTTETTTTPTTTETTTETTTTPTTTETTTETTTTPTTTETTTEATTTPTTTETTTETTTTPTTTEVAIEVTDKATETVDTFGTSTTMAIEVTDKATATVDTFGTSTTMAIEVTDKATVTVDTFGTSTTNENDVEEPEDVEAEVAKAIEGSTTRIRVPGSNARLERDGVDSFVMLTSLLVAFLVQ